MNLPDPPSTDHAPPTAPGALNQGVQSSWPTVVGILSVVFGSMGTLAGFCGGLGSLFMGTMMSTFAKGNAQTQSMVDGMKAIMPYQLISCALTFIPGVILLISGIGTLRRRRWARRVSMLWVVVRLVLGGIGVFVGLRTQQVMQQHMGSMPSPSWASIFQGPAGMVIGLVWVSAYPIFILIWFNRAAIKKETATWQ